MTRLLKLATIILTVISFASAQIVDTLNTPIGPVTQGANVLVTWTLIAGVDATGKSGALSAQDMASKNTITIDPAVPLAPKTYTWNVVVPPGTYTLGLNDGAGLKQSGTVDVVAPAGAGGAGGAGGKAPAPGAPAPGTPAPAPGAPAPKTAPAPAPAPAPKTPDTAGTPNTPNTPNTSNTPNTPTPSDTTTGPSTPATTPSSASSIFSGYNVVFSLLGVAIAMVQF